MANFQIFMLLFAFLVCSVITLEEESIRKGRTFEICNFFKEVGSKCSGCHERRICLPFIIEFTKTCTDPYPYCNNGFCSKTMGPMCSDNASEKTSSPTEAETACTSESSKK